MSGVELVVAGDAGEAAEAVAEFLAQRVSAGGGVALAGGSTPRLAYELSAARQPDWGRAEVWWGDERCVPPWDARSNFRLARESLLDRLGRMPAAVHRIQGELGPDEAAARYDEELRGAELGLALLGVGSDGHTASLFPGTALLEERTRLAAPVSHPEVDRVTLTPVALGSVETIVFLAVGGDKAEAVERAFALPPAPNTPASLVRGSSRTVVVLDRSAAGRLRD